MVNNDGQQLISLSNDQLLSLQNKEKEILKEFIRICGLLRLHYVVAYGTLLGAIRHNDFIPWDDDIDVWMPFNDFLVLQEKWSSISTSRFFLQTVFNDSKFCYPYAKIRLENTVFVETGSESMGSHNGIFVDVFPFSSASNSSLIRRLCFIKGKVLGARSLCAMKNHTSNFKKAVLFLLSGFRSPHKAALATFKLYKKMNDRHKKSRFYCVVFDPNGYCKDVVDNTILRQFGNFDVSVPNGYDEILRMDFGNYIKLPPENERFPHHFLSSFSLDLSKDFKK